MNTEATPANVGSNDGLGPLPEPAAEAVMNLFADHEGPVAVWQYLPADAMLYTANQMRQYAAQQLAAERERFIDALADACVAAEIPDSKFESLLIALRA